MPQIEPLIRHLLSLLLVVQMLVLLFRLVSWLGFRRADETLEGLAPRDVSDSTPEPPVELEAVLSRLRDTGFEQIGAVEETLPRGEALVSRVLADEEGHVIAEVARLRNRITVRLLTLLGEGAALVETQYPRGQQFDAPDYRAHEVTGSVDLAVEHHRKQAAQMQEEYGQPRHIASIDDLFAVHTVIRENFEPRRLKAIQRETLARVISAAYGALVLGGGILANRVFTIDPLRLFVILALVFAPAMLSDLWLWAWRMIRR